MTLESIEETIENALTKPNANGEQSEFSVTIFEDEDYYLVLFEGYSPAGEDICLEHQFDTLTLKDIVDYVSSENANYSVDEHVALWIDGRGKNGVPESVTELLDDAKAIGDMIAELACRLQGTLESKTGFRCPSCGQTDNFTAYQMIVEGAVDVDKDGYEPRFNKGLNYEIPDTAAMRCPHCEFMSSAGAFLDISEEV